MSDKYKDILFKEPKDELYEKVKKTGLLSYNQLEYFAYLTRFQPCTMEEMISKIEKERDDLKTADLYGFTKRTKPLKDKGLIAVEKTIKVKGQRRPKEVLVVTGNLPQKGVKKNDEKTKKILESSINSALVAIEIYNKPLIKFRSETFITLICITWTKLLHAYTRKYKGDVYYYKKKGTEEYELIDGEKKTWDLLECIKQTAVIGQPETENLKFFYKIRNKIVHSHINSEFLDMRIFGQSQAMVFNYETFLVTHFGEHYALKDNIAFSLQFSRHRNKEQWASIKASLLDEAKNLLTFIDTLQSQVSPKVAESNEYSFKGVFINGSNTGRGDFSVEFVQNVDEKELEKLYVIDKVKSIEVRNPGMLRPVDVVNRVKEEADKSFKMHHQIAFAKVFKVRSYDKARPSLLNSLNYLTRKNMVITIF